MKVAEALGEFRGNYRYNFLDTNVLAFDWVVPWISQWTTMKQPNRRPHLDRRAG